MKAAQEITPESAQCERLRQEIGELLLRADLHRLKVVLQFVIPLVR